MARNASMWKLVAMQAIVLVAVGSAVGVVDSIRRPIKLTRDVVKPEDLLKPSTTQPSVALPSAPAATPAPTPAPVAASNPNAKPGEPGWQPTPKDKLPAGQVTVAEAKAFFDQGAAFVDTRKSDEYQAGHVKDAFRISLTNFQKGDPALLAMIPRDQIIIAYCNGGHCDESEAVARMLSNSGYSKVFVLHDGFPGWKALGHPVQTGPGIEAE